MPSALDPIGTGLVTPFQRDQKADFANASGVPALSSDIGQLLGIIGPTPSSPGELPWRMELGSNLHTLRHRRMHSELVRATAEQMVAAAIRMWEPRARITGSSITVVEGTGAMNVRVSFTVLNMKPEQTVNFDLPLEE